eukprot:9492119-Lingulodinium_polyedra.AAC.1
MYRRAPVQNGCAAVHSNAECIRSTAHGTAHSHLPRAPRSWRAHGRCERAVPRAAERIHSAFECTAAQPFRAAHVARVARTMRAPKHGARMVRAT